MMKHLKTCPKRHAKSTLLLGGSAFLPNIVVRQECRTSYHLRIGVDGATLRCPSKKQHSEFA